MKILHILTSCSRPFGVEKIAETLPFEACRDHWFLIRWHIAFQSHLQQDDYGGVKHNETIAMLPDDAWIWILDDDNLVHPDFFKALWKAWIAFPEKDAIVFSSIRKDKLAPGLKACPENMVLGRVDMAQVIFKKSLMRGMRFHENHKMCDGVLFEAMHKDAPGSFAFVDLQVINYNAQK